MDLQLRQIGEDPQYEKILALALAESHRWSDVHINVDTRSGLLAGDPVTIQCAPSLSSFAISFKRLHLAYHPTATTIFDLSGCTDANPVSQLRNLAVFPSAKWVLPQPREALRLPCLSHLNMSMDLGSSVSDTLTILSASPNISSVTVTAYGTPAQSDNTGLGEMETRIIHLPQLVRLMVTSTNQAATQQLLDRLSCPSLLAFTYEVNSSARRDLEGQETVVTLQHLRTFIDLFARSRSGSSHPLTHMFLMFYTCDGSVPFESEREHVQALVELLTPLDHLEILSLGGLVITDELVRKFTVPAGGDRKGVLCPSLTTLHMRCSEDAMLEKKMIEDMIVSRWAPGGNACSLGSVFLHAPGLKDLYKESERLKKCMKEGLRLGL